MLWSGFTASSVAFKQSLDYGIAAVVCYHTLPAAKVRSHGPKKDNVILNMPFSLSTNNSDSFLDVQRAPVLVRYIKGDRQGYIHVHTRLSGSM